MDQPAPPADDQLISAADIARIAGVTRAAVSNWRRRHPDFPAPAAGTRSSALFPLAAVRTWLEAQHKSQEQAEDVQLWDGLRSVYGDGIVRGMAAIAALLSDAEGGASSQGSEELDPRIADLARRTAASTSAADVVAALAARCS
ncbi:helix-turn-helix transcriptional regulator, partial [Streptomonospora algeriensis]